MNDQFIQSVQFDWNKIDDNSYLKEIDAFRGVERIDFYNPITFFCGRKWKREIDIAGSACNSTWI